MAIRKIESAKGTRYKAVWREPGSRAQKGKTFRTKRDAERFLISIESDKQRGSYIDPHLGKTTLTQWWERYQTTANWMKLKASTRDRYEGLMRKQVLPYLGAKRLAAIKRLDVEAWITQLANEPVGPASINAAHRVLRLVLQTAADADVVASNPARGVRGMKVEKQKMRFLSPDEIDRLIATAPDRYRAFILTLAYAGLRLGEATALRRRNLDLLRGRIQVTEAFSEVRGQLILGDCKTDGSRRSVSLPKFLIKELQSHLENFQAGPDDLVFQAAEGGPIRHGNFRNRDWVRALRESGIAQPWPRIHDLRHTAVALAINVGAHPKEIQARAGHSSIMVTMDTYGHLFDGQDTALADKLDVLHSTPWLPNGGQEADSNVVALRADTL